jgi:predicted MPP superfamily phosphohydrolase
MVIFLLIALTVYGLANFYVGRRGAQALVTTPKARAVFLVLFIALALTFPLGRILMIGGRGRLTSVLAEVGTYHLAVMLYGLMAVLLVDLVRLVNAFVPFLPKSWLSEGSKAGPVAFIIGAGAVALLLAYGAWNATRLQTVELEVHLQRRAGSVDRLTAVAASDLHLGRLVGPRRLEKVVRRMNELQPDLVVFVGDIVDESVTDEIEGRLGGIMRRLQPPQGVYAALGNHETFSGLARNVACLRACGVTVLQDEAVEIAEALRLVGRRDPSSLATREVRLSIPGILSKSGLDADLPVVVLDHQPVHLEEAVAAGADFQISGHTHDGQMFPIGLVNALIYELNWGYLRRNGTQFYVTSGAGTWGPPVRIGSRAEIVRIEFIFDRTGGERLHESDTDG